jgi:hypothetical protein
VCVSLEDSRREYDSPNRRYIDLLRDERGISVKTLVELIEIDAFIPIECTGFTSTTSLSLEHPEGNNRQNGLLSFENAVVAGKSQLSQRDFIFCFDSAIFMYGAGLGECNLVPAQHVIDQVTKFDRLPLNSRELSSLWFKNQVTSELEIIGDKYNPELHISSIADFCRNCILEYPEFAERLQADLEYLLSQSKIFKDDVTELNFLEACPKHRMLEAQCTELRTSLDLLVAEYTDGLARLITTYRSGELDITGDFSLEPKILIVGNKYRELYDKASQIFKDEDCSTACRKTAEANKRYSELVEDIYKEQRELETLLLKCRNSELHIVGPAHSGKTHFAAQAAEAHLDLGLPAILLRGISFTKTKSIRENILSLLGVSEAFDWDGFLSALDKVAQVRGRRLPVIIDGIHEAESISIWVNELSSLTADFEKHKRLVLITTCRSEYENQLWQSYAGDIRIKIRGFERGAIQEAINKYFEFYKINPCNIKLPLSQFANPIFLRIFCETVNRDRKVVVEPALGPSSLLKVCEEYLVAINSNVSKTLNQTTFGNLTKAKLSKFAQILWTENVRTLSLERAKVLFDGSESGIWSQSLLRVLIEENILARITGGGNEDIIIFSYDMMAGFLVADFLIGSHDSESLIESPTFYQKLLDVASGDVHPLSEDILWAFGLMLPSRKDRHLFEFIDQFTTPESHAVLVKAFYDEPPPLNAKARAFIEKAWCVQSLREPLMDDSFRYQTAADHPFNFDFWNVFLRNMSTTERDCTWTEFVRQSIFVERDLEELELRLGAGESQFTDGELSFVSKYLMWLLCATSHPIRAKATHALFLIGMNNPTLIFDLTVTGLDINDLYVPERLLAAAFGVVMRKANDIEFRSTILPKFALDIYEKLFSMRRTISTTHYLIRLYGRQIIEFALSSEVFSLSDAQLKDFRPSSEIAGANKWRRITKAKLCGSEELAGPIHMDFQHYTMSLLNRNSPEVVATEKLYWRMKQLGYEHDKFDEVDRSLQSWRTHEDANKTDRYGKKYSRIAYLELMGYEVDRKKVKEFAEDRFFLPDIDPSFPVIKDSSSKLNIKDYLKLDSDLSCFEWAAKTAEPDISEILWAEKLDNVEGPWILLHGSVSQEDEVQRRGFFLRADPVCVKTNELQQFLATVLESNFFSHRMRQAPKDHYTFMGEIPWAGSYPINGSFTWEIEARDRDKPDDIEVLLAPPFLAPQVFKNLPKILKCKALIPFRQNCWESGRNITNTSRNEPVFCREIFEKLDLIFDIPSLSACDKHGSPCSMRVSRGDGWHAHEHALFIKKSTLADFLAFTEYELVWMIRGLREPVIKNASSSSLPQKRFQGICLYKDLEKFLQKPKSLF